MPVEIANLPVLEAMVRLTELVTEQRRRVELCVSQEAVRQERVQLLKKALADLEKGVTVNGMSHFNTDNLARLIADVDLTGQRQFNLLTTGKL